MIEGILLRKNLYQDRHIIGDLLLRNGKKVSCIFYGAQGVGKSKRTKNLDIGSLYRVTPQKSKKNGQLIQTREWIAKWSHQEIRLDFGKYSALNFGLELINKLSVEGENPESSNDFDESFEGFFKVLSNFIFFLEQEINFNETKNNLIVYFLSKVFIELGIFPDVRHCQVTGENIDKINDVSLSPSRGGFVINNELEERDLKKEKNYQLLNCMRLSAMTKWSEKKWSTLPQLPEGLYLDLIDFLSFQMEQDYKGKILSIKGLRIS